MRSSWRNLISALLWVLSPSLHGQTQPPRLLSTEAVARQVKAMQSRLLAQDWKVNRKDESSEDYTVRHKMEFNLLKEVITSFLIAQLEAEPKLDSVQLRD